MLDAVAANPSLQFYTIVNPNSGPGAPPYPSMDYVAAIAKLHTHANVKALGYVHTSWAERALADVESDIDTYAGWTGYTGADIHVVCPSDSCNDVRIIA